MIFRITRLSIIFVWIIAVVHLFISGKIQFYLAKNLQPFLIGAAIIFFFMLFQEIINLLEEHQDTSASKAQHFHELGLPHLILFAFPLIIIFILNPQGLSSYSAGIRGGINASSYKPIDDVPDWLTHAPSTRQITIYELYTLSQKYEDKMKGWSFTISGFVYTENKVPKGYYSLMRFLISCCVADASPVAILIKDSKKDIKNDTWLEITGKLSGFHEREGSKFKIPIIEVQSKKIIEKPDNPYLYFKY